MTRMEQPPISQRCESCDQAVTWRWTEDAERKRVAVCGGKDSHRHGQQVRRHDCCPKHRRIW